MLRGEVSIVGKGAPGAAPTSWCLEEAQLFGVSSYKGQMLHSWFGDPNGDLSLLSQICVLEVRVKSILGHPLGFLKTVLNNDVHNVLWSTSNAAALRVKNFFLTQRDTTQISPLLV